jgi:hypothetical protein
MNTFASTTVTNGSDPSVPSGFGYTIPTTKTTVTTSNTATIIEKK